MINNNIEEHYVSFEVAKLLKEKGFDCNCQSSYEDVTSEPFGWKKGELNIQSGYNTNKILSTYSNSINWYLCSRPTQSVTIEWLRLNFNIIISVVPFTRGKGLETEIPDDEPENRMWSYYIHKDRKFICDDVDFSSPQEAAEAALLHSLQKLIT